jgi:hypothetical protein
LDLLLAIFQIIRDLLGTLNPVRIVHVFRRAKDSRSQWDNYGFLGKIAIVFGISLYLFLIVVLVFWIYQIARNAFYLG